MVNRLSLFFTEKRNKIQKSFEHQQLSVTSNNITIEGRRRTGMVTLHFVVDKYTAFLKKGKIFVILFWAICKMISHSQQH